MKRLLILAAMFMQAGGQPISIPIQNPNFEQGEASWTFGPGSKVIQFNGIPVALAGYGSSYSQILPVQQMPVGIYTLKFSVENYFYWYPGQSIASIDLSKFYESPTCSVSEHPLGDLTQVTLLCLVRDMQAQNLKITMLGKGWESLATNYSLTFTPTN